MKLEHALKTLEKELKLLNTPLKEDEEEDYIDAVLNSRKVNDIKLALKILNDFITNAIAFSI